MPIAIQGVDAAGKEVGIALVKVIDAYRQVVLAAAVPQSRTVHVDVKLGGRLEGGVARMTGGDLGAVQITGSELAVHRMFGSQVEPL